MPETSGFYAISIVSKMLSIHPQTIRRYEELGLICPKKLAGKTRVFSDEDIEILKKIQEFTKDLGINIAGVEVILRLSKRVEELESEVSRLNNLLKSISQEKEGENNESR
ncbi:regulatory protein MerR [Thermodesulfobium narugense DSM 14796]|uniref:Regulatory protein MerR n=1 Tax=Thermodesulfobium narugense DSM 14796 TaxID=747365 RepID=M1E5Q3_9BACT|nr:chaperone modulator CbpM [Thermodesulfobium narugense]AEE14416.1 regulatory protein MerR [Thermodesulfobium narugense DSM 14796]